MYAVRHHAMQVANHTVLAVLYTAASSGNSRYSMMLQLL
jgi:hypothetical protein